MHKYILSIANAKKTTVQST